jgi:hypothetical protein
MKIGKLEEIENFLKFLIIFWECMKNIELPIFFPLFQNLLLEVHQGHLRIYKNKIKNLISLY